MTGDMEIAHVAETLVSTYHAIKHIEPGPTGSVSRPADVNDALSGLLWSVEQMGQTLVIIGGKALAMRVIDAAEAFADDVNVAVFFSRRWAHLIEGGA